MRHFGIWYSGDPDASPTVRELGFDTPEEEGDFWDMIDALFSAEKNPVKIVVDEFSAKLLVRDLMNELYPLAEWNNDDMSFEDLDPEIIKRYPHLR